MILPLLMRGQLAKCSTSLVNELLSVQIIPSNNMPSSGRIDGERVSSVPHRFSGTRSGKGIETFLQCGVGEANVQAGLSVSATAKASEGSCGLITVGTS